MDHSTASHRTAPAAPTAVPVLRQGLTYRGLVEQFAQVAERPESILDLLPIEHHHLAAILHYWRQRDLIDALGDSASLYGVLTHFLSDPSATNQTRSELVGIAVIACLRDYFAPLLLKDVQARWDLNAELTRLENPFEVLS